MASNGDFRTLIQESVTLNDNTMAMIRISENMKTGRVSLDIRDYVTSVRYTGFTKKGINISIEKAFLVSDKIREVLEKYLDKVGISKTEEVRRT